MSKRFTPADARKKRANWAAQRREYVQFKGKSCVSPIAGDCALWSIRLFDLHRWLQMSYESRKG